MMRSDRLRLRCHGPWSPKRAGRAVTTVGAPASVVVVGAGAAGLAVAEVLRRREYPGVITIVGEEHDEPYDRPPLSKQVLRGDWEAEKIALLTAKRRDGLRASWLLGTRATALDVDRRVVTIDDGRELGYGAVVIATGVRPRTLPGADRAGIHVLRTLDHAVALRAAIGPSTRLVVVGAGFLGLEAAATARKLGAEVTVVEPLERPLASRLGAPVAERLLALHREHGVRVLTGTGVTAFHGDPGERGHVREVELSDGARLAADAVLVAIGCAPAVDWLAGSGLDLDDGVVCDEHCRAAPGVWAAGDVASWHHPQVGRVRLEHRMNANEQGRAVAANILGVPTAFCPVPFFWTDQYDVKVQVWGFVPPDATVAPGYGTLEDDSFVVAFRASGSGELVGALGWNAAGRIAAYRDEISAGMEAPDRTTAG